ncbi:hypothetical protein K445DRAFT_58342, partial [Daldinia sp. EC12]
IRFKDAVGRKFSFPYHLCQTWQGMEELIKQAFLHVDVIGPHVQAGHYDLIGPNGEIILPQVWEKVIEPDWAVTMHMWPMDRPAMPQGGAVRGIPGRPGGVHMAGGPFPPQGVRPPSQPRPVGGNPPPPPMNPVMNPGIHGHMGGQMPFGGRPAGGPGGAMPPSIIQVNKPPSSKKAPKKVQSGVLGWIGGGTPKTTKSKRSVAASVMFFVT